MRRTVVVPTVIVEDRDLHPRHDCTEIVRPRQWPRATRELDRERDLMRQDDRLRTALWFAIAGLLAVIAILLVF
jgi:hypothetical protein